MGDINYFVLGCIVASCLVLYNMGKWGVEYVKWSLRQYVNRQTIPRSNDDTDDDEDEKDY